MCIKSVLMQKKIQINFSQWLEEKFGVAMSTIGDIFKQRKKLSDAIAASETSSTLHFDLLDMT